MRPLHKSKASEILLTLISGPKHVRELHSLVGGSLSTIEDRIKELIEIGLIAEKQPDAWPYRKILKLTDQGKEIAKLLKLEGDFLGALGREEVMRLIPKSSWKWPLILLYSMGSQVKGSVKLQKLFFLLKKEFGVLDIPYTFSPYLFGPYSEDITYDIIYLASAGYLRIDQEILGSTMSGDCVIERKYSLTPKGEKLAEEEFRELPEKTITALKNLERFNRMELVELLHHVYLKFPEESGIFKDQNRLDKNES